METPKNEGAQGDSLSRKENDGSPWTRPNPPEWYCTAKAKSTGNQCGNRAGFKTDHVGEGKCHLHGGLTPIKHGRYSKVKNEETRRLFEEHSQDANPLDLLPELALLRALTENFINRYDEFVEALLAWHEADQEDYHDKRFGNMDDPPPFVFRPPEIVDIADASRLLDRIGKMAERIYKLQIGKAILIDIDHDYLERFIREVVFSVINDVEARRSIATRFQEFSKPGVYSNN
jgi:hypothetical protein